VAGAGREDDLAVLRTPGARPPQDRHGHLAYNMHCFLRLKTRPAPAKRLRAGTGRQPEVKNRGTGAKILSRQHSLTPKSAHTSPNCGLIEVSKWFKHPVAGQPVEPDSVQPNAPHMDERITAVPTFFGTVSNTIAVWPTRRAVFLEGSVMVATRAAVS